jgi:hypothetical protein
MISRIPLMPLLTARNSRRMWSRFVLILLAWTFGIQSPVPVSLGADQIPKSAKISVLKVTSLYLTTRYIRWPDDHEMGNEPFVIGVVGDDSLEGNLKRLSKRTVRDRPIKILQFRPTDELKTCHILYIEPSVTTEELADILQKTADKPVLVWRDENLPHWHPTGCCFVQEDDRLLIEVDPTDLKRRGLVVEAQFLSLNSVRTTKRTAPN